MPNTAGRPTIGRRLVVIAGVAVALAAAACSSQDDSSETASTTAPAPTSIVPAAEATTIAPEAEATTTAPAPAPTTVPDVEAWTVESPESHGIDPALLEQARTYAFAEGRNTQGVVVVHDGAIVAESPPSAHASDALPLRGCVRHDDDRTGEPRRT